MAIVEDEVQNSEEENEIEVVLDDGDGDQDSGDDDSEDDDEEEAEALETKIAELERLIVEFPYNYDNHIELIQALWGLSELERWRSACEHLQQISVLKPSHWLKRLQTEISLAHSEASRQHLTTLFEQATLDCYSVPILSEWCSWSLSAGDVQGARASVEEVLRRAGPDPLSGKLFWDAKTELEKAQLENLSEDDPNYKAQLERVLFCLEEIVSRPLLHGEEALPQFEQLALKIHDQEYVDKVKKQHEAAVEFLHKITPYEDKLLALDVPEAKCTVYQEYIDAVTELSKEKEFADCDADAILKVLYDRVTTECLSTAESYELLRAYATHVARNSSRATSWRVLCACARRMPRRAYFWIMQMRHKEKEDAAFEDIKSILETALSKGMESFSDSEQLWMSYLEYIRRHTKFDDSQEVERLRGTFRLAWDNLAEAWGTEANDSEVPLYWARMEYKRMNDPKQGKEVIEEIFKYGENKSMCKYWETFLCLESRKEPPLSENKLRELHKRALKFVSDYPPAIVRLYTDFERDHGSIETMKLCEELCEEKVKEWRSNYQAVKEQIKEQNKKDKKPRKPKPDRKEKEEKKGKRKAVDRSEGSDEKKKKTETTMEVDENRDKLPASGSLKRVHEEDASEGVSDSKRERRDRSTDSHPGDRDREACTLFVSNLEFKVNEQNLRDQLSKYGEIVTLRVKAGVKAFGGSICYCQYKTSESVDEAVKHDRTPLDGRPMFLSRYAAKTATKQFKYSTAAEKNKLFVKNLPYEDCTKERLTDLFKEHGALKDVRPITFKDGKPKGLAYIEYEDESSAARALEKTNGLVVGGRKIEVATSAPPARRDLASLAAPAPRPPGMRKMQISSFIPSVLQKASTSKSCNGNSSNSDTKPLSNSDFRSMLLKK